MEHKEIENLAQACRELIAKSERRHSENQDGEIELFYLPLSVHLLDCGSVTSPRYAGMIPIPPSMRLGISSSPRYAGMILKPGKYRTEDETSPRYAGMIQIHC